MGEKQLSPKSLAVLSLIAEGQSYAQIVGSHSGITYLDIFHAAEEALQLNESQSDYQARLATIKEKHPRAYEKWSPEDDAELKLMRSNGMSTQKLAEHFLRQPSAISSRLNKFDLG